MKSISSRTIFDFFTPLALTSLLMTLSHSIINAGLARTIDANLSLAAYAVARSILQVMEHPILVVRPVTVSLVKDSHSFLLVRRIMLITAAAITGFLFAVSFSNLGSFLLIKVMGMTAEISQQGILVLRIFIFLPFIITIRAFYQGVGILSQKTSWLTLAMVTRLATMAVAIVLLLRFSSLPGASIGALGLVMGMSIEAVVVGWKSRKRIQYLRKLTPNPGVNLTYRSVLNFMGPLVLTYFTMSLIPPLINVGLARLPRAEISLAAYSVAWGICRIFTSPTLMIRYTSLVLIKGERSLTMVRKFISWFGLGLTGLMIIISFSPMGGWILATLMGVSLEVKEASLGVMRVMSFLPLALTWREFFWGIIFKGQKTRSVAEAKMANLLVLSVVLFSGVRYWPGAGPVIAALAMIFGAAAELITIYLRRKKIHPEPGKPGIGIPPIAE